jgi:hypothetical protein
MKIISVRGFERWLPERPDNIPAEQIVEYDGNYHLLRSREAHEIIRAQIEENTDLFLHQEYLSKDMDQLNLRLMRNAEFQNEIRSILFKECGNPPVKGVDRQLFTGELQIARSPKSANATIVDSLSKEDIIELIKPFFATLEERHGELACRVNDAQDSLNKIEERVSVVFWIVIALVVGFLAAALAKHF